LLAKTVYVNDVPLCLAFTWGEAYALIRASGRRFAEKPGAAEGPTGFYFHGKLVELGERPSARDQGAA
jgi:hypothetical protein